MKKHDIFIAFSFVIVLSLISLVIFFRHPKEISSIENRALNDLPEFKISEVIEGGFQSSMETALMDQMILGETIKNGYNILQNYINKSSKKALAIFYPETKIWPLANGVTEYLPTGHLLTKKRDKDFFINEFNKKIENYNNLINNNPELSFYLVMFDRGDFLTVEDNLLFDITEDVSQNFSAKLNYTFMLMESFEQYTMYYYKTDYHWNNYGSYQGYVAFMKLIFPQREPLVPKEEFTLINTQYVGSTAIASGDNNRFDTINVYSFDLEEYTATKNGEDIKNKLGLKGSKIDFNFTPQTGENQYNEVFGYNFGEIIYDFKSDEENALIFVESFSNPINELIAREFNKSYFIDLRIYESQKGEKFKFNEYIKDKNIGKVIFMGNAGFFIDGAFFVEE